MITVGIDEVGRGCWAGPLVAGAVILNSPLRGVKDSKKLSKRQREFLSQAIHSEAQAVGVGWVWPAEIDELGLTAAVRLAMERSLDTITDFYDEIIIDGNINFLAFNPKARAIIKADDSVACVSAASIVAKVARDRYMEQVAREYPQYGFEKHVGYGTPLHLQQLKTYGVTTMHRKSYRPIKVLLEQTR